MQNYTDKKLIIILTILDDHADQIKRIFMIAPIRIALLMEKSLLRSSAMVELTHRRMKIIFFKFFISILIRRIDYDLLIFFHVNLCGSGK